MPKSLAISNPTASDLKSQRFEIGFSCDFVEPLAISHRAIYCDSWRTFWIFLIFSAEGEVGFSIENPRRGGVFQEGGGVRGQEGVCGEFCLGGGDKYFLGGGPKFPPRI